MIDLSPRCLATVKAILAKHVPGREVRAFGSRATWTARDHSDLDIAVVGHGKLNPHLIAALREAFEDSDLPMRVDVLDWHEVADGFREEIERRQVVLVQDRGGSDPRWPRSPLGNLVSVHKEQVRPSSFPERLFAHHSIPAFDDGQSPVIEFGSAIKSNKFTVPSDAVLVSRLNPRFPRVWAPDVCDDFPAICSTEFLVLRPRSIDRRFLHHLCMSPSFRTSLLERVTGTSGSHQRVAPVAALEIEVAVPTVAEQRAIAHILGTLEDKIELNRQMNETLEAMARALFNSWFVDFDPVRAKMEGLDTGLPHDIADLLPDRLVDSEVGEIPLGWKVAPLDEIARFQNGLALQKFRPAKDEARLPVVKIAQLRSGEANSGEWASAAIRPECIIEDGDVLFSWSGSLLVKTWCGGRAALNQHLFKVTSARYPKWFFLHSLLSHLRTFRRIAQDKATTMGHIRRHHLTEALCVAPPDDVIERLSGTFSCLLSRRVANELSSRTLAAFRDTLLPQLISGELRVHGAESRSGEVE